jgi:hypothetical protein
MGHFRPSPPVADWQLSYREADGLQGLSRKIGDGRLWPSPTMFQASQIVGLRDDRVKALPSPIKPYRLTSM